MPSDALALMVSQLLPADSPRLSPCDSDRPKVVKSCSTYGSIAVSPVGSYAVSAAAPFAIAPFSTFPSPTSNPPLCVALDPYEPPGLPACVASIWLPFLPISPDNPVTTRPMFDASSVTFNSANPPAITFSASYTLCLLLINQFKALSIELNISSTFPITSSGLMFVRSSNIPWIASLSLLSIACPSSLDRYSLSCFIISVMVSITGCRPSASDERTFILNVSHSLLSFWYASSISVSLLRFSSLTTFHAAFVFSYSSRPASNSGFSSAHPRPNTRCAYTSCSSAFAM